MSCIHNVWNCYCKVKEDVIDTPCSPLCKNYCTEETSMKNIFNKGPATNTNCACNESTPENDYVSMLEMFINKLYTDHKWEFFMYDATQAEEHVDKDMRYLGYNTEMVNRALFETINNFKTDYESISFRLYFFLDDMLRKPHKDYEIPVKELTIKQIEDLLGYKIKIVGEH